MCVYTGKDNPKEATVATSLTTRKQVPFATAVIATVNIYGQRVLLRALLDQGSQGSMITKSAVELLQIKPAKSMDWIIPVGSNPRKVASAVTITIKPHFSSSFETEVECYVLTKIIHTIPDENLHTHAWKHLKCGFLKGDPPRNKTTMLLRRKVTNSPWGLNRDLNPVPLSIKLPNTPSVSTSS